MTTTKPVKVCPQCGQPLNAPTFNLPVPLPDQPEAMDKTIKPVPRVLNPHALVRRTRRKP